MLARFLARFAEISSPSEVLIPSRSLYLTFTFSVYSSSVLIQLHFTCFPFQMESERSWEHVLLVCRYFQKEIYRLRSWSWYDVSPVKIRIWLWMLTIFSYFLLWTVWFKHHIKICKIKNQQLSCGHASSRKVDKGVSLVGGPRAKTGPWQISVWPTKKKLGHALNRCAGKLHHSSLPCILLNLNMYVVRCLYCPVHYSNQCISLTLVET